MGAGGLQALVKQGLEVNGKRIVVAGSGPLLVAVAAFLRGKGATVAAVVEQAGMARSLARVRTSSAETSGKGAARRWDSGGVSPACITCRGRG